MGSGEGGSVVGHVHAQQAGLSEETSTIEWAWKRAIKWELMCRLRCGDGALLDHAAAQVVMSDLLE